MYILKYYGTNKIKRISTTKKLDSFIKQQKLHLMDFDCKCNDYFDNQTKDIYTYCGIYLKTVNDSKIGPREALEFYLYKNDCKK